MESRKAFSAKPFLPETIALEPLRAAAQHCRGCDLYRRATQTVFGEGTFSASIVLVGEQPGDKEDKAGHPFVGPAGELLNICLVKAGIHRANVYVTNAVKHFKWEPRGNRRLHKKPTLREMKACRPWLDAEIQAVAPVLVVCLGATAAQGLLGSDFKVTHDRGTILEVAGYPPILATIHPSALLHMRGEDREREQDLFIRDLARAAQYVEDCSSQQSKEQSPLDLPEHECGIPAPQILVDLQVRQ